MREVCYWPIADSQSSDKSATDCTIHCPELGMIKGLREIGRVNDAPILVVQLQLADRDWIGLAYRNNLQCLSICFWSARDEQRMATNTFVGEIAGKIAALDHLDSEARANDALFDVQYMQPMGWDRWLGGVPRPMRGFFDEVLYPKLKAALEVVR